MPRPRKPESAALELLLKKAIIQGQAERGRHYANRITTAVGRTYTAEAIAYCQAVVVGLEEFSAECLWDLGIPSDAEISQVVSGAVNGEKTGRTFSIRLPLVGKASLLCQNWWYGISGASTNQKMPDFEVDLSGLGVERLQAVLDCLDMPVKKNTKPMPKINLAIGMVFKS